MEDLEKTFADQAKSFGDALVEMENAIAEIKKRKDVNPKSGIKKYGDVRYADEKNKKYPIDTPGHIRAAWNYIHKKHNAGKYDSGGVETIKKNIVSAWKKHIDKGGPPSAAKGSIWDCPFCQEEKKYIDNHEEPMTEAHYNYHMNDLENSMTKAQEKLKSLSLNNVNASLDQELLMENLEYIGSLLEDAQSCVDIMK